MKMRTDSNPFEPFYNNEEHFLRRFPYLIAYMLVSRTYSALPETGTIYDSFPCPFRAGNCFNRPFFFFSRTATSVLFAKFFFSLLGLGEDIQQTASTVIQTKAS